jgi:hypothetical protein
MSDDDMRHSPTCPGGPLTTQQGFTVLVTRCEVCGAVASRRRVHPTPAPKNESRHHHG